LSVIRLIYRSENAMNVGGSRLLVHFYDIVATARRRNAETGIDGFLMFDRTRYHQILEGPEQAVNALYAAISKDQRHRNLELLSREAITTRHFKEWSMSSFLSDQPEHPLRTRHNLQPNAALDANTFLRFALDFVKQDTPQD
jgi:Sensors of blue-light using FAD